MSFIMIPQFDWQISVATELPTSTCGANPASIISGSSSSVENCSVCRVETIKLSIGSHIVKGFGCGTSKESSSFL